jgi:hypothetical protein
MLKLLTSEWLFSLFNRANYIFWADLIQKNSICNIFHMESCVFKSCLICLQWFEELVGLTICDRCLLDDTVYTIYIAHLAMHFVYGFDLLCQILDQGLFPLPFYEDSSMDDS